MAKCEITIKNICKGAEKIQHYEGNGCLVVVEKEHVNRYATSISSTNTDQIYRLLSASIFQAVEALLLEGISQDEISRYMSNALQHGIGNAVLSAFKVNGDILKQ